MIGTVSARDKPLVRRVGATHHGRMIETYRMMPAPVPTAVAGGRQRAVPPAAPVLRRPS